VVLRLYLTLTFFADIIKSNNVTKPKENVCQGIMAGAIMTKTFYNLCVIGAPYWKNYTWSLTNGQLCQQQPFVFQNLKEKNSFWFEKFSSDKIIRHLINK